MSRGLMPPSSRAAARAGAGGAGASTSAAAAPGNVREGRAPSPGAPGGMQVARPLAGRSSDRIPSPLTRSDADYVLDGCDEDLAISDASRARPRDDRGDRLRDALVRHEDRELHLGQEIDDVFGAAEELRVALLPPKTRHVVDRHSLHPDRREAILHLIELERLDDRVDPLHTRQRGSKSATSEKARIRAGARHPRR